MTKPHISSIRDMLGNQLWTVLHRDFAYSIWETCEAAFAAAKEDSP